MNSKVFRHELSCIGWLHIDEEMVKYRAESRPNNLINLVKICFKNWDFPFFHHLPKFISDQRDQKNSNTVKRRLTLSFKPVQVKLSDVAENDWEDVVALRRFEVEELNNKCEFCSDKVREENQLGLEHIFKWVLLVLWGCNVINDWVDFWFCKDFFSFFQLESSTILVFGFFNHDNIVLSDLLFYQLSSVINVILQVRLVSAAHELAVLVSHFHICFLMIVPEKYHHWLKICQNILLNNLKVWIFVISQRFELLKNKLSNPWADLHL